MKTKVTVAALVTLLLFVSSGRGDVVVPLVQGGMDSGWDAVIADNVNTGIVIDLITSEYVVIEIAKIFPDPPSATGRFTPNLIEFRQRLGDAETLTDIRIADEIIFNATGSEWEDYHWRIVGEAAAFDRPATEAGGFSINPFTNKTWGPSQVGWDLSSPDSPGDHPAVLNVDGGLVPDRRSFLPGLGSEPLFIDVKLGEPGVMDSDFILVQTPTPEPATAAVVALGGMVMVLRRRRRGRAVSRS